MLELTLDRELTPPGLGYSCASSYNWKSSMVWQHPPVYTEVQIHLKETLFQTSQLQCTVCFTGEKSFDTNGWEVLFQQFQWQRK